MPIYEYLCPTCNCVYSFLVKSLSERREPSCPKCGAKDLRRRVSRFAVTGAPRKSQPTGAAAPGAAGPEGDGDRGPEGAGPGGPGGPADDPRIEREMMQLMNDAEGIDENDPRQLGRLMRRMSEISGEPVEPEMEEAMRRLEAGEDPEKIEEDLGDALGGGDEEGGLGGAPSHDPGLYDL